MGIGDDNGYEEAWWGMEVIRMSRTMNQAPGNEYDRWWGWWVWMQANSKSQQKQAKIPSKCIQTPR